MKQVPIELNVEQWRRDVKAFVSTTLTELDEITNQLSSEVASPGSTRSRSFSKPTTVIPAQDENVSNNGKTSSDSRENRLAALKQKLSNLK